MKENALAKHLLLNHTCDNCIFTNPFIISKPASIYCPLHNDAKICDDYFNFEDLSVELVEELEQLNTGIIPTNSYIDKIKEIINKYRKRR